MSLYAIIRRVQAAWSVKRVGWGINVRKKAGESVTQRSPMMVI